MSEGVSSEHYFLHELLRANKLLTRMTEKITDVLNNVTRPLTKTEQNIINDIRRRHSLVGQKNGKINEPIHRNEFKRYCKKIQHNEECKVSRFYYPDKKEFSKVLMQFCNRKGDQKSNYKQVGFVNVNLKLCWRCHDAGKSTNTDLYFINILDSDSHIRQTLCYGCMGAIINEIPFCKKEDNQINVKSSFS